MCYVRTGVLVLRIDNIKRPVDKTRSTDFAQSTFTGNPQSE